MEQVLEIKTNQQSDLLEISVSGRIDTYRAGQLDEFIENAVHTGNYHLLFDLGQTSYISSTGIRIFVKYYKQLRKLNGSLVIAEASDTVKEVFKMVGMNQLFVHQSRVEPVGSADESSVVNTGEAVLTFRDHDKGATLELRLYGNPEAIHGKGYTDKDHHEATIGSRRYGIGLGAIGSGFDDCSGRYGEFLAVNEVVACQSTDNNRPDFLAASGNLQPIVNMLYGLVAEGGFGHVIRFDGTDRRSVSLSSLAEAIHQKLKPGSFFMVTVAETSGLVGVALKRSPLACSEGESPFSYPALRDQVYFTTEPDHKGALVLCAGMVSPDDHGDAAPFLRPLNAARNLFSHFHAAVFPFHLLRKDEFDLQKIVSGLFEMAEPTQILHLINDDRDLTGVGETEFLQGFCWIGKIDRVTKIS